MLVKGYSAEQIKALIKQDESYSIGLRLYAVYQVALGQPTNKLEELYNTSFKQICNWVHRFEESGIEGLRDKPRTGRPCKLMPEQLEELRHIVTHSDPANFGMESDNWNGPVLMAFIQQRYDVEYKKAQVYNLINSFGLRHNRKQKAQIRQVAESLLQDQVV